MVLVQPVINLDDHEFKPRHKGMCPPGPLADRFEHRMAQVSVQIGARRLWLQRHRLGTGEQRYIAESTLIKASHKQA